MPSPIERCEHWVLGGFPLISCQSLFPNCKTIETSLSFFFVFMLLRWSHYAHGSMQFPIGIHEWGVNIPRATRLSRTQKHWTIYVYHDRVPQRETLNRKDIDRKIRNCWCVISRLFSLNELKRTRRTRQSYNNNKRNT